MSESLREIRLYGWLGQQFGRVHRLVVSSPAEAIRALCVIRPGFEAALASSQEKGVRYACFVGRTNISEAELHHPAGDDAIRIAPVLAGSKRGGLFQTILGAALVIGAGLLMPGSTGLLGALGAKGAYGVAAAFGFSMFAGGVVQLLSPQQRSLSTKDRPENGASYNFNGPVNTSAQGGPVPLLYGRMIIGSATISAGIYSEDQV